MLFVVHTDTEAADGDEIVRIISARRAEREEEREYYDNRKL